MTRHQKQLMPQHPSIEVLDLSSKLPPAFKKKSGRYEAKAVRSTDRSLLDRTMILRIDLEGDDRTFFVSGDLFNNNGADREHWRSFRSTAIIHQPDKGLLRCPLKLHGRTGKADDFAVGRLDLSIENGQLQAEFYQYFVGNTPDGSSGRVAATPYLFRFDKRDAIFRRATVQVHSAQSVVDRRPDLFHSEIDVDDTAVTVESAFRSAGVELTCELDNPAIPDALAFGNEDDYWSDEELHAAVIEGTGSAERVDWSVNLLFASNYLSDESDVTGIMFDSGIDEPNRQGAAVFSATINRLVTDEEERRREFYYTTVHELGHTFNLLHSFQKDLASGQAVLPRPSALSWMNYPALYPYGHAYPSSGDETWDGTEAFWAHVKSQQESGRSSFFDLEEIIHLRHGDRLDVIMGGRWAASGPPEAELVERESNASRPAVAELKLNLPGYVGPLEQIEGYVRLKNVSGSQIVTPANLRPGHGAVDILIRKPNEKYARVYRPISLTCGGASTEKLDPDEERYANVFLSYGHRWWYVDDVPGPYQVQAICRLPSGSLLRSEVVTVRVQQIPTTNGIAELKDFFSDETGLYFALNGSRCDRLKAARERITTLSKQLKKDFPGREFQRFTVQANLCNAWLKSRRRKCLRADRSNADPDRPREAAAKKVEKCLKARNWLTEPANKYRNPVHVHAAAAAVQAYVQADNRKDAKRLAGEIYKLLNNCNAPDTVFKKVDARLGNLRADKINNQRRSAS